MQQDLSAVTILFSQIGVGAIFFWIWFRERSDHKETMKRKDDISDRVLAVFQDNIRANEGLKNTIEGNTKVVESLTQKIDNVVRHK